MYKQDEMNKVAAPEKVKHPQLVRLRQIEASLKAIDKWDGRMPKVTSGAIPFIDVKSLEEKQ